MFIREVDRWAPEEFEVLVGGFLGKQENGIVWLPGCGCGKHDNLRAVGLLFRGLKVKKKKKEKIE